MVTDLTETHGLGTLLMLLIFMVITGVIRKVDC